MLVTGRDWYFKDKSLAPGQGHGRLAHEFAALTLVLHGRLEERFEKQAQRCSAWQLHFKPAGIPHETATGSSGVRMFLLAVRGGWVDRLGLSEVERPRALESRASAVRALNHFLEIIRRSDVGEDPEPGLRALLAGLAPTEPPRLPKQRPSWITEVAEKALDAGEASPTLSQLAEQYNVHPVYLARAFRRHYGTSIGAVRRQARIERAIALLAESTIPLADVALEAGYADQSHLCRELKRETDWSPGRLRRHASALGRLGSG